MGHLHMKIQGLQSTKAKPLDTDLEDKIKNEVFYTTVDPSITKEGKNDSDLCLHFPTTLLRVNNYIYVIYL